MTALSRTRWQPATLPNSCTEPVFLPSFNTLSKRESDDESGDHEVMEQSPEDAGHYPMLANTTEEGESLSQLFEYTVPDWAIGPETAWNQQTTQLRRK